MLELDEKTSPTRIKLVGIGGGGMNALNRMIDAKLGGVEFIAVNTDEQALGESSASQSLAIGRKSTKGMGAGGDPEVGAKAAMEDQMQITELLRNADMVFITAGMGGGTGTGAAPIVADLAKSRGALVVGVVTLPFNHEGQRRMTYAQKGWEVLRSKVDTLITIRNDSVFKVIDQSTSIPLAFRMIDDILLNAVRGISDLINSAGLINVDFADVRAVMKEGGDAVMGAGEGAGENKAEQAVNQAIHNSLLEENAIKGAKAALIHVYGGEDLPMVQLKETVELIRPHLASDANIIVGLMLDPALGERLRVTVIATGFSKEEHRPLDRSQAEAIFMRKPGLEPKKKARPAAPIFSTPRQEEPETRDHADEQTLSRRLSQEEWDALHTSHASAEAYESSKKAKIDLNDLDIPAYLRRRKKGL